MREFEIYAGRSLGGIVRQQKRGWAAFDPDLVPLGVFENEESAARAILAKLAAAGEDAAT